MIFSFTFFAGISSFCSSLCDCFLFRIFCVSVFLLHQIDEARAEFESLALQLRAFERDAHAVAANNKEQMDAMTRQLSQNEYVYFESLRSEFVMRTHSPVPVPF
jgi:hypothetical protein